MLLDRLARERKIFDLGISAKQHFSVKVLCQ